MIEVEAAVDALMNDSGLPRFGPHRHTVERRQRLAFVAARVPQLSAENARLREALGFYADPASYDAMGLNGTVRGPAWRIAEDNGRRARKALELATTEHSKEEGS